MRPLALTLCLVAVTAACDEKSPVGPTVAVNERFTLAPTDVVTVRDLDLSVQFVTVTGDSRCPADAPCIQEAMRSCTSVLDGGSTSSYELHTGDSSRATVTHGQVRIGLVELQPYPFSTRMIAQDYWAAMVTRDRTRPGYVRSARHREPGIRDGSGGRDERRAVVDSLLAGLSTLMSPATAEAAAAGDLEGVSRFDRPARRMIENQFAVLLYMNDM